MVIYPGYGHCTSHTSCPRPQAVERDMMAAQKVALITAGTAGLGAQVARALAPDFRVVWTFHIKKTNATC